MLTNLLAHHPQEELLLVPCPSSPLDEEAAHSVCRMVENDPEQPDLAQLEKRLLDETHHLVERLGTFRKVMDDPDVDHEIARDRNPRDPIQQPGHVAEVPSVSHLSSPPLFPTPDGATSNSDKNAT